MTVIETEKLTKKFNDVVAVDDISLHVKQGEIYGFLGLNGAGKTTTIRLLLGMIKPGAGSFTLFGRKISNDLSIWNEVGYLVETAHAYPELTVRENLEVMFRLRGLADRNLITGILDALHLTPYRDRQAKHLSSGNNQRLALAKALIHSPKLLILDEPVNGLDPEGIVEIRMLFEDLAGNHNTTIFLSSHILSEISKLATRIGIIHEGKLIKELTSSELHAQIIKKLYVDTVDNNRAVKFLQTKGFKATVNEKQYIEISDPSIIQKPEKIATLLVHEQVPPKFLHVIEENLESYFLRIIGMHRKANESAAAGFSGRSI